MCPEMRELELKGKQSEHLRIEVPSSVVVVDVRRLLTGHFKILLVLESNYTKVLGCEESTKITVRHKNQEESCFVF